MRKTLLFILLLFSLTGNAQELQGIWRGYFNDINYQRESNQNTRYKFEVQIDQEGNNFQAVTYSYRTTVFYGKATAQGTFNPKTNKVYLEELKLVEVKMTDFSSACIMTCFLQYSKSGEEEFLEGDFFSNNTSDNKSCGRGTVFLRKVTTSDFYKEPFDASKEKTPKPLASVKSTPKPSTSPAVKSGTKASTQASSPVKPLSGPVKKSQVPSKAPSKADAAQAGNSNSVKANLEKPQLERSNLSLPADSASRFKSTVISKPVPKVLVSRTNEVAHIISTKAHTVEVRLYDNGYVDNDTISVYLDNELLIGRHRLTDKAISFTIDLDASHDFHELVMVAENLGEIPPNTSLMIVNADGNRYEIRITSTEQKNAVVQFKFEH
jgi:hypothetical protein